MNPPVRDSFGAGVHGALRGIGMLKRPGLRRYVVLPLLVNLILFAGGFTLLGRVIDHLISSLPSYLQWLEFLIWPLFILAGAAVVFFLFTIIATMIAAPFNGLLAEAVQRQLRGELIQTPFTLKTVLAEVGRSMGSELRKFRYMAVRAIPCLLLFLIPGLNLLAPWIWLAFGAWMLSLEYLEIPLGNNGYVFPHVLAALRQRRRMALGFGAVVMGMTMIPVLNFIAMPAAVCGATALCVEHALLEQ
ncbi:MAG: sulfate transporter CysZ [Gammaproteobacteria bacterium]|nr:sulfate transporter CysZ [Gammaproteobacteria bacterium]